MVVALGRDFGRRATGLGNPSVRWKKTRFYYVLPEKMEKKNVKKRGFSYVLPMKDGLFGVFVSPVCFFSDCLSGVVWDGSLSLSKAG